MTELSIIIVNFNARFFLQSCLESILESEGVKKMEIIVVDNHSSDGSCQMLKSKFPGVVLIENEQNLGFSTANNMGVSLAKGEFVLILNPDTLVDRFSLSKVISFYRKTENCGAVGVRFIDGSGMFLAECKRNFPSIRVAVQKLLGLSKGYYASAIHSAENAEVAILSGAFLLVRKDRYLEVGGFDEDFFMYGEDIDLCYRLMQAGYQNYYLGETSVIHFKGQSTPKDKNYVRNFYGAFRIFYRKHFRLNPMLDAFIAWSIQGMIFVKSLVISSRKQTNTEFKSFVYIGNREDLFDQLKINYPLAEASRFSALSEHFARHERLFIDTATSGYQGVFDYLQTNAVNKAQLRIISKEGTYYLGSDNAYSIGEVVELC